MPRALYNSGRVNQLVLPLGLPAVAPVWRPIHYLGSKLRLVGSIRRLVSSIGHSGDTVCDLFAGSGTAAVALAADHNVIAADIQEYSRVLCSALLQPARTDEREAQTVIREAARLESDLEESLAPILELEEQALANTGSAPSLLCDLAEHGSLLIPPVTNDRLSRALNDTNIRVQRYSSALVVTRYFGGAYFSYRQALQLDCLLQAIGRLQGNVQDTYLAAVLSTASTVVNSVGKQFAQPMRPRRKDGTIKAHVVRQMRRDRCLDSRSIFRDWLTRYRQLPLAQGHRVIRGDYRDVLGGLKDVSVVYADPPYTRDHYSRFYHVLETIALRDAPTISATNLMGPRDASRGMYREHRHQSPFCIKSQAAIAFRELFERCRGLGASVLVSYSPFVKDGHPRLMTVEGIEQIAKQYYRHVRAEAVQRLTHSKLNKSELHLHASADAEVFLVCQN